MLTALAAVLEFAQAPARSAPNDNTVAIVGLAVAAVAGVAGPIITALFARSRRQTDLNAAEKRQQDALNAEQTRQDSTLLAERERLDRQLAGERERLAAQLADLADLRTLLDEAVVAPHRARHSRSPAAGDAARAGRPCRDRARHRPPGRRTRRSP